MLKNKVLRSEDESRYTVKMASITVFSIINIYYTVGTARGTNRHVFIFNMLRSEQIKYFFTKGLLLFTS